MPHRLEVALFCRPIASEMSRITEAVPITTPMAVSITRPLRRPRLSRINRNKSINRMRYLVHCPTRTRAFRCALSLGPGLNGFGIPRQRFNGDFFARSLRYRGRAVQPEQSLEEADDLLPEGFIAGRTIAIGGEIGILTLGHGFKGWYFLNLDRHVLDDHPLLVEVIGVIDRDLQVERSCL